jgi:hypothetical protein
VFQNPDVPSRRLRRLTISGVSSGSPADPEHPITPCGPFNFSFLEAFGVPLCRLKAGETLFRTGEEGKPMFLVVEGQIEVQIAGKPVAGDARHRGRDGLDRQGAAEAEASEPVAEAQELLG